MKWGWRVPKAIAFVVIASTCGLWTQTYLDTDPLTYLLPGHEYTCSLYLRFVRSDLSCVYYDFSASSVALYDSALMIIASMAATRFLQWWTRRSIAKVTHSSYPPLPTLALVYIAILVFLPVSAVIGEAMYRHQHAIEQIGTRVGLAGHAVRWILWGIGSTTASLSAMLFAYRVSTSKSPLCLSWRKALWWPSKILMASVLASMLWLISMRLLSAGPLGNFFLFHRGICEALLPDSPGSPPCTLDDDKFMGLFFCTAALMAFACMATARIFTWSHALSIAVRRKLARPPAPRFVIIYVIFLFTLFGLNLGQQ